MNTQTKWLYNKAKHQVDEQPTMGSIEFTEIEAIKTWNEYLESLRHLPVSGEVTWADKEDVTGKFRVEKTTDDSIYSDDLINMAIPIKQEQPKENNSKKEADAFLSYMDKVITLSQEQPQAGCALTGDINAKDYIINPETGKALIENQSQEQEVKAVGDEEIVDLYARFFSKQWEQDCSLFDKLIELQDYWDDVYKQYRLQSFTLAKLKANEAILNKFKAALQRGHHELDLNLIKEYGYLEQHDVPMSKAALQSKDTKITEQIAAYVHEIDSLRETNRKLGEQIAVLKKRVG